MAARRSWLLILLLAAGVLPSDSYAQRRQGAARPWQGRTPRERPAPAARESARPGKPSGGMAADPSSCGRVSGLALTVQDAGWPTISMYGAANLSGDYLGPVAFALGTVSAGQGGRLLGEDAGAVTNRMTFGPAEGSPESLQVYVTRLSPAVVVESQARAVSFFGLEEKSAAKTYIGPQYENWWGRLGSVSAGAVRPLRWAAPGPGGKVLTGVCAAQKPPDFPAALKTAGLSPARSLAPARASLPPLERLNSGWLLLWYGADSRFAATRMPFIDWKVKASGPKAPFWPLADTLFQPDVPLLLVFQNAPESLALDDRQGLRFTFAGAAGKIAMVPLFGHAVQPAEETEGWLQSFPDDLARRCDAWAERLAHLPVDVAESVTYDRAADRVTHAEKFEFLAVRPQGRKYAPLPAMLALARREGLPVEIAPAADDGHPLATQFGPAAVVPDEAYTWSLRGLGRYVRQQEAVGPPTARSAPLEAELAAEVDRVLKAGHLAPLFYMFVSNIGDEVRMPQGTRYWTDPSEPLYLLSELLPVLPPAVQDGLKGYLRRERAAHPPETTLMIGRQEGVRRERFSADRDRAWVAANDRWNPKCDEFAVEDKPSLYRAYGLSRYYAAVGERPEDGVAAFCRGALAESLRDRQWDTMGWFRGKYSKTYSLLAVSSLHQFTLRCVNRDLAGVMGCLRIAHLRSEEAEAEAWGHLARLAVLRFALGKYARYQAETGLVGLPRDAQAAAPLLKIADFRQPQNFFQQVLDLDQHRVTLTNGAVPPEPVTFGSYLVPYRDLVPEAGRLLADWGLGEETRVYLSHYAARNPSWFVLFGDAVDGRETPWLFLADMHQLFMAHAWIAKTDPDTLAGYIDVPYAKLGDLFYLHKLAETIKACRGLRYVDRP